VEALEPGSAKVWVTAMDWALVSVRALGWESAMAMV
jgi:hypothetical protein